MKFNSLLLCFIFSLSYSANLMSQNETEGDSNGDLSEFLIIITTNERGFQMECKEGCNWVDLSFHSYTIQDGEIFYKKAVIDEAGVGPYYMSPDEEEAEAVVKTDQDFAFIVQQTEEGVFLESIKGTAWKKLSYRCVEPNCRQAIDEMGMAELDEMK